ncbi:Manganese transport system membrane protein MntB [Rubripirellula lacrimiformis]|uniref:Manganese transport system membrane protein MntB n=1 Tax=Rubripirellula lacrimiformis TaxID=1930273 RepID=A0A517NJD6_9BACT|nr:metal ABC transporter permease [Rubripirellula lacrimiformis]QDT07260.1 Manganese transport system membrane protein MntB [Rubripirellula lacrimiformis]
MIAAALVWSTIDTWILLTASLVAASSAIPGCFLFLRKQSMIADALTHAALPGVVAAFVVAGWLQGFGIIDQDGSWTFRQSLMFGGAMTAGLLTAFLTQWVSRSGWIRGDAAMGVVFTTLFAIGLIMLRQFADQSDIDLECVLYGQLDTIGLSDGVPAEAITCALMLVVNLVLVTVLFKELMLTTFDPELAGTLGLRPEWMHYGLMTITTATIVTAFEVVGSILAIGMLVIPPSTAFFISRRLRPMIAVSMSVAVSASVLGHLAAITLPGPITSALGLPYVESVTTSGAIVLVAAAQLLIAMLIGPERGILVDRYRATRTPAGEAVPVN